jgi:hypothetical protein
MDPYAPGVMGFAYYMLKRFAEALPHLQECVSRAPNLIAGRGWLAATHTQLDRLDDAGVRVAEMLRIDPSYAIDQIPIVHTLKRPDGSDHYSNDLRKAGLPELIFSRIHRMTF